MRKLVSLTLYLMRVLRPETMFEVFMLSLRPRVPADLNLTRLEAPRLD
jgi:hypothetical protein